MEEIGHKRMDSLEEKVSVFFHGDLADQESDRSLEEEDDYESDNNLHDPMERALFWESQEALLQTRRMDTPTVFDAYMPFRQLLWRCCVVESVQSPCHRVHRHVLCLPVQGMSCYGGRSIAGE